MGIEGLATKQGRGRKSKLVDLLPEQVDSIIKNVRLNPQSLREVAAVLSEEFGFLITKSMIKQYIKKN